MDHGAAQQGAQHAAGIEGEHHHVGVDGARGVRGAVVDGGRQQRIELAQADAVQDCQGQEGPEGAPGQTGHADGQGHGAEGHDTVAGQGIQHMAAEQTHQDDGGGVAHEEHGRGGAGGHAQALHEVDGQGRHDAEGKAGQIDAAQAGVGHGIEDGARRHLVLGRIGGDLGLAQLGGQGHEHAQCGDGQHGHEGEQTGLTAQQGQDLFAYGRDDGIGQQGGQGEDGEAPGALALGDATDQHGHHTAGVDRQRDALGDAQAQDQPDAVGPVDEGIGQHDAAGKADGDQQGRQLAAREQHDAGQGPPEQDHGEQGREQDAAPVGADLQAFQPLFETVEDGHIAVVAHGHAEKQDEVATEEGLFFFVFGQRREHGRPPC